MWVVSASSLGGAVAAVSDPFSFEQGSWLAAFLVLVGGVVQIALGAGQAALVGGAVEQNSIVPRCLRGTSEVSG